MRNIVLTIMNVALISTATLAMENKHNECPQIDEMTQLFLTDELDITTKIKVGHLVTIRDKAWVVRGLSAGVNMKLPFTIVPRSANLKQSGICRYQLCGEYQKAEDVFHSGEIDIKSL